MRSEARRLAVVALGLFAALGAEAQIVMQWRHGAGELHRAGGLVPFHARLENPTSEDRVVVLEGSWEGASALVWRRVDLAAGARKELDLYLGPAWRQESFTVRLMSERGELLEQVLFTSVWVAPSTTVVGLLHAHPMGWGSLQLPPGGRRPERRRDAPRAAFDGKLVHLDPERLPSHVEGLRTFDLLIWPEPRPRELTGEQTRALAQWVETGGHLVLATATAGQYVLGPWTTVDVGRAMAPRDLGSLAAAGGAALGPFGEPLAAVALRPGGGEVWLEEPWGPIAVDERRGSGRVTVLGFDPASPPVDRWAGLGRFWLGILQRGGHAALSRRSAPGAGIHGAIGGRQLDLRTTARTLLTRKATGPDLPLAGLGLLFLLYMAVIGPGEYLLLRRFDRLKWTWLTFPVWVALFSLVSYGVVAASKSDVALVRHVLLRDLATGAERFAEELHAALFVTRSAEYRLVSRTPDALPMPGADVLRGVAFSGVSFRPPTRIRGLGSRGVEAPPDTVRIHHQGEGAITDRVVKWSFLTGTFLGASPVGAAGVESELLWRGRRLEGRITSRLGSDLEEAWLLVAPRRLPTLIALGRLGDGASVEIAGREPEPLDPTALFETWLREPRDLVDLARFLTAQTGRRLVEERLREVDRQFERFFDDPHPHHDWSPLLEAGNAVLIGWSADPEQRIAALGFEVEHQGIVIYRVLLETSKLPETI